MKVSGSCHCGLITIEGEADPERVTICNCTDCQTGASSAFRVSVPVSGSTFKMNGQPTAYTKTTSDSGRPRVQPFCPKCGTPIYSTAPGPNPASYGLRVGALDRRAELRPTRQGWCRSALPWSMDLTDIERFERQP